jgi:hypothetical protein
VLELTSRRARLFWEMLDRADYAVTYVKCWAVDLIYGSEHEKPSWPMSHPSLAAEGKVESRSSIRTHAVL